MSNIPSQSSRKDISAALGSHKKLIMVVSSELSSCSSGLSRHKSRGSIDVHADPPVWNRKN